MARQYREAVLRKSKNSGRKKSVEGRENRIIRKVNPFILSGTSVRKGGGNEPRETSLEVQKKKKSGDAYGERPQVDDTNFGAF